MKQHVITVVLSLISALVAVFIYKQLESPQEVIIREDAYAILAEHQQDLFNEIRPRTFLSARPTDFIDAANKVRPAVVSVTSEVVSDDGLWNEALSVASGSGVILSPDGLIVTNNHVIEEAENITVSLNDRREFSATVVGVDESTDLALLKVEGKKLPYIELGNSDSLQVGEWVLAVGNPFNLESTVTAGIVSAKGRSIDVLSAQDRIESFIQTDAVVNSGNSGGALVNTNGELIGVNTAIMTVSGNYEGYSFAVPANLMRKVIRDLRDYGEVQRGLLGIVIEQVDSDLAKELQLPLVEGVYIKRVVPGAGADRGGLKSKDVIIGVNGVKVATMSAIQEQIGRYRPGNTVTVEYFRKGKIATCEVVLLGANNETVQIESKDAELLQKIGVELKGLSSLELANLGIDKGVKILSVEVNSLIGETNMDPGFVVTHFNKTPVASVREFVELLQNTNGEIVLEGVYESYPGVYYYTFKQR